MLTTPKIDVLDLGGKSLLGEKYSCASSAGGGGKAVELHWDPLSIVCAMGDHLSNVARRQDSSIGSQQLPDAMKLWRCPVY
jgi:hypothetical protein